MSDNREWVLLGFSEGTSDKQYRINIVQHPDGNTFTAFAQYGKRGRLSAQTNIVKDVSLAEAYACATSQLHKKQKKGYSIEATSPGWDDVFSAFKQKSPPPKKSSALAAAESALAAQPSAWF